MSQVDYLGYPCAPRSLDKDDGEAWFYEQQNGLEVVQELRGGGNLIGTTTVTIPWSKVCAAVDRHRKIKAKRKK